MAKIVIEIDVDNDDFAPNCNTDGWPMVFEPSALRGVLGNMLHDANDYWIQEGIQKKYYDRNGNFCGTMQLVED